MASKQKKASYSFKTPNTDALILSRKWLVLGINALAFAGLFSVLLVMARSPGVQEIIPWLDFFHTALVVHVDLSVLVWLLSFSCVMWVYSASAKPSLHCRPAYYTAFAGVACIIIAPFTGNASPLMNNYIPVLQTPMFFLGLSLFAAGIIVQLFLSMYALGHKLKNSKNNTQISGVFFTTLIMLTAVICFIITEKSLAIPVVRELYDPQEYYELLFWAGGHILQYVYTLMMIIVWLWLAQIIKLKILPSEKIVTNLYILTALIVLPTPISYYYFDITSFEHVDFFTQHMRYGGGIAALVIGGYITLSFIKKTYDQKNHIPERNALLFSVLLFGVGGVMAFMIHGSNVVIPAHYHGSIVGVTLAFMGITYHLLPKMGYKKIKGKMANLQPVFYGGGQLIHITGLAWSGGYGALRKTPGAVNTIEGQMGMGMMGLGGLLSIIGGLLFVIVAYKSILHSTPKTS